MYLVRIFAIAVSFALLLGACNQNNAPTNTAQNDSAPNENISETTPTPEVVNEAAAGKKLFTEYCVKCHKEAGTGGAVEIEGKTLKAEDLTSAKMIKEPDEEYLDILKNGVKDEGMPSFAKLLTEDQMKQVVKYIRDDLQK